MLSLFPQLLDFSFYGPLFLRLALAAVFLVHGSQKLFYDKIQFVAVLEQLKFKPGKFWAWLVALVEFFGGIFFLFGFFTQLAAIVLLIEFLVIIFWVRRGQPFAVGPDGGRELDFVILTILFALLVLGPGAWAIDRPY